MKTKMAATILLPIVGILISSLINLIIPEFEKDEGITYGSISTCRDSSGRILHNNQSNASTNFTNYNYKEASRCEITEIFAPDPLFFQ